MQRVRFFLQLQPADQRLLLVALPLTALVRLGLWLLPFRVWQPLLVPVAARPGRARPAPTAAELAWAVATASRSIPAASCLTQALAARLLLAWFGHAALVRIGVARDAAGRFVAHAWVESAGQVVIGGSDATVKGYNAFARLQGGRR